MKNLLICVTGLTPQIVTETLFCLSQKRIQIDELYILTTSRGRDVILGMDSKKLPPLRNEINRMCRKYKMKVPLFQHNDKHIIVAQEQSIELSDIRNDKHNKLFPNKVCEFLREKTSYESIVYCSISGGRKSMSVDLAFALSLFGREKDQLLHVLTHERNEFKGFFPENKKEEKDLELAFIPFVRLRTLISGFMKVKSLKKASYTDLVELMQSELTKRTADKLTFHFKRRQLWYGENESVYIGPKLIDLYRYFIDNNGIIDSPIKIEALITHFGIDKRTGENIKHYNDENIRPLINKLNKAIRSALGDSGLFDTFKVYSGSYGDKEYYVNISRDNVEFID